MATITKIDVLSVAKIQAVLGLIIGIIGGVFMAIGLAFSSGILAVLALIGIPIIAVITSFIGGAINALLFNLAASLVGGLEIELQK